MHLIYTNILSLQKIRNLFIAAFYSFNLPILLSYQNLLPKTKIDKNMKKLFVIAFLMSFSFYALATHNRAGEIIFRQISPLEYEVTIITYTKTSSANADRDSLRIEWGDGTGQVVLRSNGNGVLLPNDVKRNEYTARHTYPGRATYKLSMTDQNRNANILNVNPPNSMDVAFHLETVLTIGNPTFDGFNNSPILLQPPIDVGCVGERFVHNPNGYDAEGDSIAYELIIPYAGINTLVPNYSYPNAIAPGNNNNISLDPRTGAFVWDAPRQAGEYNVAFLVKEYRHGRLVSSIIRDIQIEIRPDCNHPPKVTTIDEKCIVAGDILTFNVLGTDIDLGDKIKMTATGGPLRYDVFTNPIPATFPASQYHQFQPYNVQFRWQTSCENIREQYYQVVFRAVDNSLPTPNPDPNNPRTDTLGLADLKTVRIRVVGPPAKGLFAVALSGKVDLSWDKPYKCEGIAQNRFKGFNIWRREKCPNLTIDTCGTNLVAQGFVKIKSRSTTFTGNKYTYTDNTVARGRQYSYVVTPEFIETNSTGFPTNIVEGLPSEKVCVQLARDLPLMLNADVKTTSTTAGSIFVKWSKPYYKDLDTLQNGGGYRYILYQAEGDAGGNFVQVWQSPLYAQFFKARDTSFTVNGLNTVARPYRYRVAFIVKNTDTIGVNEFAASHFLTVASTDRTNNLSWTSNVPWTDSIYHVFRKNAGGVFVKIAQTTSQTYSDANLENGKNYCYVIQAFGTYNTLSVASPLINWSQEQCGIPLDSVPPCPPILTVTNDCATATNKTVALSLKNTLNWTFPNTACWSDAASYNIYYSPTQNGQFTKIGHIDGHNRNEFLHEQIPSLAGCYYVTAIDSVEVNGGNNESRKSNIVCIDNCPYYELPNVFTPNSDGMNDTYTPFIPYRFVTKVDIRIFNRWGAQLYQTSDPMVKWDGHDQNGSEVAEGVYFYECTVYEQRLEGEVKREKPLSGFIQLIRGK